MRLKTAIMIVKEVVYLKSVLKHCSDSLERGKYILFDGFRAMSKDDSETQERAKMYFAKPGINPKMALLASKLNKISFFLNKNKKSSEEYDAFYTANNYDKVREIKLFSFKRNKMLTICKNKEDFDNQLKLYELLRYAYNLPPVAPKGKYANAIEISMVNIEKSSEDLLALENIARSTINFNPDASELKRTMAKDLIKSFYDDETMSLLEEVVSNIDENVLDMEIPICLQHGDLSKDNLLYGKIDDKSDFWWIDWEHLGERVFFYDYFFYITNSAMYYDTKAYDCYMNGEADGMLAKFFNHFGVDFVSERKKDYLALYLIIFLKERVCNQGILSVIKKYIDLLQKM